MSIMNRALTWLHHRRVRGRHRLYNLLAGATQTTPLVCAETRYGAKLLLNPYEYVDNHILAHGFYESEVFEALKPHFQHGSVFWDIGSNTGLHGISVKVCFPDVEVICFEPVPLLANRILENAKINGVSLAVFASALGARCGSTWITVTHGNLGMSHTDNQRNHGAALLTAVQSADEMIASGHLAPPTIIKIDTEGSETAILAGMENALRSVQAIVFEAPPTILDTAENSIRMSLDPYGFNYRMLQRAEPTAHNLENFIAERIASVG